MLQITVVGSGDAFGSGGRFNTCFMLEYEGERALIDCGASSLIALKRLAIDPDSIGTIVITHLHGDHFGGLVFLLREATLFRTRTQPLVIGGPPGLAARLRIAMEAFFPGGSTAARGFALTFVEFASQVTRQVGCVQVQPFEVSHACGAPPFALRVSFGGRTVTYTGDTEWVDSLIPASRGADLLICEAYLFDGAVNKHLSYKVVRERLGELCPRRLLLTHLNRDMLENLAHVTHEVAHDGLRIEL